MGFFSDLKEDLSQAVNELIPDEELNTVREEQTAGTLSLDEMLENIDSIQIPAEDEVAAAENAAEDLAAYAGETAPETAEGTDAGDALTEDKAGEESSTEQDEAAWDLDSMLESALSEETARTTEKTEEYKGAEKTMEMNTNRTVLDETSIITAGMTITGDIVSEGSMEVTGNVNGNIELLGKLNITGHINGNSKAAEIFAEGAKINGEIISEGAVKIGASTVIVGNITATSAAIAGAVKGDIDVKGPVVLDASAIVMGNIKSKSVQINNGAVIEGMCSQCYADVSPTSFFEDYKMETKKDKSK